MTLETFRIGNGVGPFGRWFRLFAGIDTVVYVSINPVLLHPVPSGRLAGYFGSLAGWLLVITAAYFAAVWLFGRWLFGRWNPWAGTAIFLGVPTLLSLLDVVPGSFRVAFGFYVGASLIGTFFMRYGGCEVVAFPSLVLGRRYTMYCPYNAIDAVERGIALDDSAGPHPVVAIVSLAITLLVGGYFVVERIGGFLGRFGLGFALDDRLAWLLFVPAAYLAWRTLGALARERSLRAVPVRKFGLGAVVLTLVTISLMAPEVQTYALWLAAFALGILFTIAELALRALAARASPTVGAGRASEEGA